MSSFLYAYPNPLDRFKQAFLALPNNIDRFFVALSGGLDSYVLLHATRQLFPQQCITAVHINHGLQSEAINFEKHCQAICEPLNIPLLIYSVKEEISSYKKAGHSPEDAARKARYKVLNKLLNHKDCLLTGHHLEDQSETLLLQLMRGAGVKGLGGIRLLTHSSFAYHLRPLLYWNRKERLRYAEDHQLKWIEDPSNQDQTFRRNFIRDTIVPHLKQHWPHLAHTLGRVAHHFQEASNLCNEIAIQDLLPSKVKSHILSVKTLLSLSRERRRNALRYWLNHNIEKHISAIQFESVERLLYVQPEEGSTFDCASVTIKRYRDHLYLLKKEKPLIKKHPSIRWHIHKPLTLPNGEILTATLRQGKGICPSLLKDNPVVEVRFREGGERFHPKGHIGSHPLKKLFQKWAIPPWKRYHWPLIYYNKQLIAVTDYAISEKSAVSSEASGLWISTTHSTTIAL